MEDYIFLIIAIVLSIFGAIKQSRKKKIEDNPFAEKAKRTRNYFMDQLLGEDFLEEPESEVKPQVKIMPVVKKIPVVSLTPVSQSNLDHTRFKSTLPDRPMKNLQPTIRKSGIKEVELETETDDSPSYLEDFSLRKAFVFSEIMGRKY